MASNIYAQETIPYREIPEYPSDYESGNVIARFIDGLGFRYYWATEGLTEKDLTFAPSKDARTSRETLQHLLDLSISIAKTIDKDFKFDGPNGVDLSLEAFRSQTLKALKHASEKVKNKKASEVAELKIVFNNGSEFDLWHLMNGQIADAIWHVGQIVSFRRSSGNPLNPKVSVFLGKLRD